MFGLCAELVRWDWQEPGVGTQVCPQPQGPQGLWGRGLWEYRPPATGLSHSAPTLSSTLKGGLGEKKFYLIARAGKKGVFSARE